MTMNDAWQQTSQQTRRLQVWLKHSLTHLSQPEAITFENDDEHHEHETESSTPNRNLNSNSNPAVVHNIDEALHAFSSQHPYHVGGSHQHQEESQHDWILDGHPEWELQYEKSRQLRLQMASCEIDDEQWLLQMGSIGNQEYQFAAFGGNDNTTNDNDTALVPSSDPTTPQSANSGMSTTSSSSFGDFQQATPVAAVGLVVAAAAEVVDDNNDDDNDDDDDDFGDFQEANITNTTCCCRNPHTAAKKAGG
jgi:hypothetical protein